MADTMLMFFLGYLVIGSVFTMMAFLLSAYRARRYFRYRRLQSIKTLFGVHYQRKFFLLHSKR